MQEQKQKQLTLYASDGSIYKGIAPQQVSLTEKKAEGASRKNSESEVL